MQFLKVLLVVLLAVNLSAGFFFKKKKVHVYYPRPAPVYRYVHYSPPPVYHYQSYYHQPTYYHQPAARPVYSAPTPYPAPTAPARAAPAFNLPAAPATVTATTPAPSVLVLADAVGTPTDSPVPPVLIAADPVATPMEVSVSANAVEVLDKQSLPAFEPAAFQAGQRMGQSSFTVVPTVGTELIPSVAQGGAKASVSGTSSGFEIVPSMLVKSGRLTDSIEIVKSQGSYVELPPETVRFEDAAAVSSVASVAVPSAPEVSSSVADFNRQDNEVVVTADVGKKAEFSKASLDTSSFDEPAGKGGSINLSGKTTIDLEAPTFNAPLSVSDAGGSNTFLISNEPSPRQNEPDSPSLSYSKIELGGDAGGLADVGLPSLKENPPAADSDGVSVIEVDEDDNLGSSDLGGNGKAADDALLLGELQPTLIPTGADSSLAQATVQLDEDDDDSVQPDVVASPLGRSPPTGRQPVQSGGAPRVRPPPSSAAKSVASEGGQFTNTLLRSSVTTPEEGEFDPLNLPEVQDFLKELGVSPQTEEDARRKKHVAPHGNLRVYKSIEIDPHIGYSRVARQ